MTISKLEAWLRKRKLDVRLFADNIGVDYNTVYRWFNGHKPRRMASAIIRAKYPDCPLIRTKVNNCKRK